MSIRPETVELLDRFLATERNLDDLLEEVRQLLCDVTWAADYLYQETELLAKHAPKGFCPDLEHYRAGYAEVGGQAAIDRYDAVARLIRELGR